MYKIPSSWGVRREPRTPLHARDMITFGLTFDEQFDHETLFANCINIGDNRIVLVGPPLYDLKDHIQFSDGKNVLPHTFYDLSRVQLTLVEGNCDTLYIKDLDIAVEKPSNIFEGMGCATVMMKNEPITWIRDWISFYYKEHGVTGFCIHNNRSTDYTIEELREGLAGIDGVVIEVVDWDMPYGPHARTWDSDFGKYVMYESFKYKYGWCAKYVLNHDIDELLMLRQGTLDSLITQMDAQGIGALIYGNRNIDSYNELSDCHAIDLPIDQRSFSGYHYYSNETNNAKMFGEHSIVKWVTLPKHTMQSQWMCHEVSGDVKVAYSDKTDGVAYFAHFYSMQTKNRSSDNDPGSKRNTALVPKENLLVDAALKEKLFKVFN